MKNKSILCHYLAICAGFAVVPTRAATEWTEFRGSTGQGLSSATNVPIYWSTTNNVVWKTAIPGHGWSSPLLADGRVYLTLGERPADSDQVSLRVACLDAHDGQFVWNVEVLQPPPDKAAELNKKNSLASATPILRDGRLYAHFGQMGTAALDLSGKVLWQQTKVEYPSYHGNGGSPVLVDDLLVFNCDGKTNPCVVALDKESGDVRWKSFRHTDPAHPYPWSFSTPLVIQVDGQTQIVSGGSGYTAAYDPADGREIWRVNYGIGHSVIPRPVAAHGLVYFCSGFFTPIVFAVNPEGASGEVTDSKVVWQHNRSGPKIPSPIVVGDEIYFVSEAGVASCLDAESGHEHWSERLGGNFSASPVSAEGRLYFQNEEGTTYVVRATKQFELMATNALPGRVQASPAVADNRLFLRTDEVLWCMGK